MRKIFVLLVAITLALSMGCYVFAEAHKVLAFSKNSSLMPSISTIVQAPLQNIQSGFLLEELPPVEIPPEEVPPEEIPPEELPPEELPPEEVPPEEVPPEEVPPEEVPPEEIPPEEIPPEEIPPEEIPPEELPPEEIPPSILLDAPQSEGNTLLRLDATTAVAYTFAHLKEALSKENGITTVYLGDDITIEQYGIVIHPSKQTVVIDGTYPLGDTGVEHALLECPSFLTNYESTILIKNAGITKVTLQNMIIVGRNYYGTVCVMDSIAGVTLSYDNIVYNGPQITFNPLGTAIYNDVWINIEKRQDTAASQEIAEIQHVVFSGESYFYHNANAEISTAFLHASNSSPSYEVLPDAKIWIETIHYFMFSSSGTLPNFKVGAGAKLTLHSARGLHYDTSVKQSFKDFTIKNGAEVLITQSGHNILSPSTLKIAGRLLVQDGASFEVHAFHGYNIPLIQFMSATATASFENPSNLILSNSKGRLFDWKAGSGNIAMQGKSIKWWQTIDAFYTKPEGDLGWSLASEEVLTANIATATNATSATSFIPNTYPAGTHNIFTSKVLQINGTQQGEYFLYMMNDQSTAIQGIKHPASTISLSYLSGGLGTPQSVPVATIEQELNAFSAPVPTLEGTFLPYTKVRASFTYMSSSYDREIIVEDTLAPTATPILQTLLQDSDTSFLTVSDLLADLTDNAADTLHPDIATQILTRPVTTAIGMSSATVRLTDFSENTVDITIPALICDANMSWNAGHAIRALSFATTVSVLEGLANDAALDTLILSQSLAQGWNIVAGTNVDGQVTVFSKSITRTSGEKTDYEAVLALGQLRRTIHIKVTGGILCFGTVPTSSSFVQTTIFPVLANIYRNSDTWTLSISDTRGAGSKWRLSASIAQPLSSGKGDGLLGALVFIKPNGTIKPLSSTLTEIFAHTTTTNTVIPITWDDQKGIILRVYLGDVYADVPYQTTLTWTLHDTP